jgi:hypothetical protein
MTKSYTQMGDEAIAEAFRALMAMAVALRDAEVPLSSVHHSPNFTYLMTPKQFDRIKKICCKHRWDVPNQRGILIDLEAVAHPLDSRVSKDNCTPEEAVNILIAAYSAYSEIGLNRPKHSQAIVFNTNRGVMVGQTRYAALAVVKVCNEGGRKYLAPVTAYHATEAKIRDIQ